jgi:polar amino acid transport system substrate-binding protein
MSGANPTKLFIQQIGSHTSGITNDNIILTINFSDGSIGSICYIASGDLSLSKERIEMFADGKNVIIKDFKIIELYRNNKKQTVRTRKQEKGYKEGLSFFFDSINKGNQSFYNFESMFLTTLTTFKVYDSLSTGLPISIIP